ncbi:MAG: hypothetical protein OEL89_04185 [Candidatus Peregrinibacteria bacterium]|nr:hypothetical protein [Candidatus Peregrinibacteria bacterium]
MIDNRGDTKNKQMKNVLISVGIVTLTALAVFFGYRYYKIITFEPREPLVNESGVILTTEENAFRNIPTFTDVEDVVIEDIEKSFKK